MNIRIESFGEDKRNYGKRRPKGKIAKNTKK